MSPSPPRWLLLLLGFSAVSFQIVLGYAMVGLPWLYQQVAVHFPAAMHLLIKVSLADLLMPLVFCLALWQLGVSRVPRCVWVGLSLYTLVVLAMGLGHRSREDLPYWLGQLLHVTIYLTFFLLSRHYGVSIVARQIVFCWAWMTPLLWVVGLGLGWQMNMRLALYKKFTPLLLDRFQLIIGNPNKLGAFNLFVAVCLIVGWGRTRFTWVTYVATAILVLSTALTRSRDFPLVLLLLALLAWRRSYRNWQRWSLRAILAGLVALTMVATLSLYYCVFPLLGQFPFLNFSQPSTYEALAHRPHETIFAQATLAQKLWGRGYAGLEAPYHQAKDPALIRAALTCFDNPQGDQNSWFFTYWQPHNAFLQVLNAGGLLWLFALLALSVGPLYCRRAQLVDWKRWEVQCIGAYLLCLLMESLSQDSIHYRWVFAGLGLVHALAYSLAGEVEEEAAALSLAGDL